MKLVVLRMQYHRGTSKLDRWIGRETRPCRCIDIFQASGCIASCCLVGHVVSSSEKLEDQAGASLFLRREILVAVEGSLGERICWIPSLEGVPVFRIAAPLGDAKAVHQLGSLFHCFRYYFSRGKQYGCFTRQL